jgi:hypothetical protein
MSDSTRFDVCEPTEITSPAQRVARRAGRALAVATLLLSGVLAAAPASAQYVRVRSVKVSKAHAELLKRSRWARRYVVVTGLTMTAQRGLSLLQNKRTGTVHVVPPSMSRPPRTMSESIIVPPNGPNDQTVAYHCGCSEQDADPNDDSCGFLDDDDYTSACVWEGDGESRCSCMPMVLIWGNGEEHILTYAGDPVW